MTHRTYRMKFITKIRNCQNLLNYFDLIRYLHVRYTIFTCIQKLTNSQLNLAHGIKKESYGILGTKVRA